MATYDPANVQLGVAWLFTAPANTTKPADTVEFGTDWTSPWAPVGATEEGVTFSAGTDTTDLHVEEQSNAVATTVTAKNIRVSATLAEDTMETLLLALGGGTLATQSAATGVIGKKTISLSDTLSVFAVGFDTKNKYGFWRRIYIPRATQTADVSTQYRRAAAYRTYGVEFSAICRPDEIFVGEKTAAAL
jgi:hypothetical protein